ncbi:MAG: hypothetical protein AAF591_00290 [Verrucomicrobiota bacterium]
MIMTPIKSLLAIPLAALLSAAAPAAADSETETLNVLFIGNSYTGRHNLSELVKEMAEAGNPGLTFNPTTVIYGGRTLADHWRLGTQNFVGIANLTKADEEATIASLKETIANNPEDSHAARALARHEELLADLESQRTNWDVVVLQSYRDDLEGNPTSYAQFAPKFAELAQAQGARVILYETTPTTQNLEALAAPPDPAPVHEKANAIAALANQINAQAAPMSLVALHCQTERPDLTLRFINDAHLNHTMAYLTASTLYAALFNQSPQGIPVDSVTDIRFLNNDPENKDKDRDGNPITRTFNEKDRADLQRIAWEGFTEFQSLRDEE